MHRFSSALLRGALLMVAVLRAVQGARDGKDESSESEAIITTAIPALHLHHHGEGGGPPEPWNKPSHHPPGDDDDDVDDDGTTHLWLRWSPRRRKRRANLPSTVTSPPSPPHPHFLRGVRDPTAYDGRHHHPPPRNEAPVFHDSPPAGSPRHAYLGSGIVADDAANTFPLPVASTFVLHVFHPRDSSVDGPGNNRLWTVQELHCHHLHDDDYGYPHEECWYNHDNDGAVAGAHGRGSKPLWVTGDNDGALRFHTNNQGSGLY